MKNWSVQMQDQNGRWFYIAGDMLECDARRWFEIYWQRSQGDTFRLCQGDRTVLIAREATAI